MLRLFSVTLGSVLVGWMVMGACSVASAEGEEPAGWVNQRLRGSPEPPLPYTVEPQFTNIEWKSPLYVIPEPATNQLWVVLQGGERDRPSQILGIDNDPDVEETRLVLEWPERLIYGLTFAPDYEQSRHVYVFTNGPTPERERTNRVSRFLVEDDAGSRIDLESELPIISWRSMGHDGGDLAFGLDGMLYITSGDGTSDSDVWNSGQDVTNLLATLIRIDVREATAEQPYQVPPDNPLLHIPEARPEIFAYGFRNPWRMSIDPHMGYIWVGNNGQDLWETAHLVQPGDNYGWSVFEGSHPFYLQRRRGPTPIIPPTIEHHHVEARSLTGGVVYYGDRFPELTGAYIYGDYGTGKIWGVRHRDGEVTWQRELADTTLQIAAFRIDQQGELLIVDHGGGIYRLIARGEPEPTFEFPTLLSETGLFLDTATHEVHPGLIPYQVNTPGWMDGAQADRYIGLPAGTTIQFRANRALTLPDDSVILQTLWLDATDGSHDSPRRLESRILLRQAGEWAGYSYRWREDQSDAELVPREGQDLVLSVRGLADLPSDDSTADSADSHDSTQEPTGPSSPVQPADPHAGLGATRAGVTSAGVNTAGNSSSGQASLEGTSLGATGQAWRIPSRTECLTCHSRAVGFVLGLSRLQLDRDIFTEEDARNQLVEWKDDGVLTGLPDKFSPAERQMVSPYDSSQDLDLRARSYLHANCSMCHVEAGGGNAQMELEFSRTPEQMRLLGVRPQHDTFHLPNAMLVAPGAADRSVLLHRLQQRGRGQMPPLGTLQVDAAAVELLHQWIEQMPPIDMIVRHWTMADLVDDLEELESGRSFEQGRDAFQMTGCRQCHHFDGDGGTVGPNLNQVAERLTPEKLLESILEPSKEVSDEYATYQFVCHTGLIITGQIEREDDEKIVVRTGTALGDVVELTADEVETRVKSPISNMPAETLNVLEREQILDLLAYLLADGKPDSPRFESSQ